MAKVTIKRTDAEAYPIEGDKRQYMPFKLSYDCPECGNACADSLLDHYLSYPKFGHEYEWRLYCGECEWEGSAAIIPTLELRLAEPADD